MDNNTFGTNSNNFKVSFLEMQYTLIENFIYKWFLACQQTKTNVLYNYQIPRLDFAIKFYRTDYPSLLEGRDLEKDGVKIYPNFIYYFEGVYPEDIELFQFDQSQGQSAGKMIRDVRI